MGCAARDSDEGGEGCRCRARSPRENGWRGGSVCAMACGFIGVGGAAVESRAAEFLRPMFLCPCRKNGIPTGYKLCQFHRVRVMHFTMMGLPVCILSDRGTMGTVMMLEQIMEY